MAFSIFTIILFFIYSWGLGYSITYFLKNSEKFLERNLIRIGIGLGVFVVLGVILNALHIPIDWKIFLVVSMILPIINIARGKIKLPDFKSEFSKKNLWIILALIIFLASLFIYTSGAFNYPYLEDDDPWDHAQSIKYVATEKTVNEPIEGKEVFQYIDPYPPGYNLVFGVLHQTTDSLMWTMKFFNALIISLSVLFFFFFAKEFMGDERKALLAMFVLATIPCFLSHFIWAHSLVIMLFFPALYCLERIKHDKKWIYATTLIVAAIWMTQPSQAVKLTALMGIYFVIKSIYARKFLWDRFAPIAGGIIISMIWWASKLSIMYSRMTASVLGKEKFAAIHAAPDSLLKKLQLIMPASGGTATRAYTFSDFFFAKAQNMINNPIGVGIVISILVLVALVAICIKYKDIIKEDNSWIVISVLWLIFTFLGVNSMTFNLPIGLHAFRFWMLLAIPVSLLVVVGVDYLLGLGKSIKLKPQIMLIIIIIGLLATAGYQKYSVNTATWPPGVHWSSYEEVRGFDWMRQNFAPDTRVLSFCSKASTNHIIGFDMFYCDWCEEEREFQKTAVNKSAMSLNAWLKENEYEYLVIDSECAKNHGIDETNNKLQELIDSKKFSIVHSENAMAVLRPV